MQLPKPKRRGSFRKWLGKRYFIARRYVQWYLGKQQFAKQQQANSLPILVFQHQTPLLRRLKDVDMYLQHNKITNLRLAAQKINGLVLRPGEVFSFWYRVGRPSRSKGYLRGLTLDNGKISTGIGGGLCQMGNLIYWMSLHSPLTVVERWRHSYDVFPDVNRKQPFGSGATLAYNYVDLQIQNTTKQDFQLSITLNETHLKGAIFAHQSPEHTYQIVEKNHHFIGQSWGGHTRHNQIFRQVFQDEQKEDLLREELITENHAVLMYVPFLSSTT